MPTQSQRVTRWDLTGYDCEGQLILLVEIKSRRHTSPEWAAKFRRNILAHGVFPKVPYFLMVFTDKFYLWADEEARLDESEPNYVIDARPIFQPYFEKAGIKSDREISEESLELIFSSWFTNIIYSQELPNGADESQRWLIDSGLYAAIAGGSLQHEAGA
ncbi:hypothetical protein [Aerosakkonema funiforme]|uniref:hypothetical protein n=1 Tax=Aerosakkonema funiforme TaxID=1246630 RepID=UPI0035BA9340